MAMINAIANLLSLVATIAQIAIIWQLFEKAEVSGWKAIVPIYNILLAGRISGAAQVAKWYVGLFYGSLLGLIVTIALYAVFAFSGASSVGINILLFLVGVASVLAMMGSIVPSILLLVKFIQAYTAGIGRWLVFIFLPLIGAFVVSPVGYKKIADQVALAPVSVTPTFVPAQTPSTSDARGDDDKPTGL